MWVKLMSVPVLRGDVGITVGAGVVVLRVGHTPPNHPLARKFVVRFKELHSKTLGMKVQKGLVNAK